MLTLFHARESRSTALIDEMGTPTVSPPGSSPSPAPMAQACVT